MFGVIKSAAVSVANVIHRRRFALFQACMMLGLLIAASGGLSAAEGDLPDLGVDISPYATSLGTKLADVIGAAIAIGFAIYALLLGVRYVKRLVKG